MTTRRKLQSVNVEVEIEGNNKRSRGATNGGKGKDKGEANVPTLSDEGSIIKPQAESSTTSTRKPRGPTYMDSLTRDRALGIRKKVDFDSDCRPVGENAALLQSYVGVLARQMVKIIYTSWKKVPNDVKETIWESVNLSFVVSPAWKKACMKSANEKWKQFKSTLTVDFVVGRSHDPQMLNTPPPGYDIPQADWSQFVITRMSEDFQKLSEQQRERRSRNKYPHRLSRKGYARLQQELGNELGEDGEVNRAILWKKGRVNKQGQYDGDELKATVQKIDDCIELKKEGKLRFTGNVEDVLSVALDSPQHPGRVRAVGSHVTPTVYFNVPQQKQKSRNDILLAQQNELMETRAQNLEMNKRIAQLEAAVFKMGATVLEVEEKGSCSVKQPSPNTDEIKRAKKESPDKYPEDKDMIFIKTDDAFQGQLVALTLEPGTKVVAHGTVVPTNGEKVLLHGAPIPRNCVRVAVDHATDGSAPLPVPIPGECASIADAIGTHVAWPVHLIKMQSKEPIKKQASGKKEPKLESASMPRSLHMLYCYCKVALQGGNSVQLNVPHDIFGKDLVINVFIDDIAPFCELKPISYNCIVVYICHLYKKLATENKLEKYRFIDPYSLGYIPGKHHEKLWVQEQMEKRSRLLADRLIGTSIGQMVLVPVNLGFHWVLTVIDPHNDAVYLLDPLHHRNRDEEWKLAVNLAIKLFNVEMHKSGRKQPAWEVMKAPLQPDSEQCGYFVMRYMRQIIDEFTLSTKAPLRSIFTKKEYSREEIDEVRVEWAECLQDYINE